MKNRNLKYILKKMEGLIGKKLIQYGFVRKTISNPN